MQVRMAVMSPEETQQYGDTGNQWQRRNPTWRGMAAHGLAHVDLVRWTDRTVMVESSRDPFMAPSGHVPCKALGGGEEHSFCWFVAGWLQVSSGD